MSEGLWIGVVAVLVWSFVARVWLPTSGVKMLRRRLVRVAPASRGMRRHGYALWWSIAQVAVLNALMFSAGIGGDLAAGTHDARGVWAAVSGLGFVTGYVWFWYVSRRAVPTA